MDFEVIFEAHVGMVFAQTTTQMSALGRVKTSHDAYLGLRERERGQLITQNSL